MRFKFSFRTSGEMSPTLRLSLLFSFLFLIGIFAGVLVSKYLNLTAKQALFSDLTGFIYGDHSQTHSMIHSLWQISRMPLFILCMSFTCFGTIAIPFAVMLQGYLLSFSVSAMIRLLGWKGSLLGVASFGVGSFVLVPCLLILSVQCFLLSKQFFLTMFPSCQCGVKFPRGFVLASVCCLLLLPLGAVLDHLLTDAAVSFVLNHFIF